ncbi:MAG: pilus assembly protein TadG-related protein [Kiritimatiellae bacterium]|nr:pilus assembly protein TadG-related protein [Kiritimatiellia bacterium]
MKRERKRQGQIILVMAFMMLGLLFLMLVNADVFLAIRGKGRLQNAGDAAALAAARWQGITLNGIGALNLAQVDIACKYAASPSQFTNLVAGVQHLQERLVFAGPCAGLYASQCIAAKNGMNVDPGMTRLVNDSISGAAKYVPGTPSWPTKSEDYAMMLRGAVADGVYAGCDNAQFFNYSAGGSHPLYNRAFYQAVDSEDWCWFFLRDDMFNLLKNFNGWGDVPAGSTVSPTNPEFYPVAVSRFFGALRDVDPDRNGNRIRRNVIDLARRAGCENVNEATFDQCGVLTNDYAFSWYVYNGDWRAWTEMHRGGPDQLPLRSDVQPKYDVFGCSSVTRVVSTIKPLTPGTSERENLWTAAAKPFGEIDGRTVTLDGELPLVTPAFTAVRLIMLAGASEARQNMAEDDWVVHTRDHVASCAEGKTIGGCRYCMILDKWDKASFRQKGVIWLERNSDQCIVHTGGGGGPSGGTRHAR